MGMKIVNNVIAKIIIVITSFTFGCAVQANDECPSLNQVAEYTVNDDLKNFKKSVDCGFDLNHEDGKALHIAIMNNSPKVELYLRENGLSENIRHISKIWYREKNHLGMLDTSVKLYELENSKFPSETNWRIELLPIVKKEKWFSDVWGRYYIYTVNHKGYPIFCTLGKDGARGGAGYDQDICLKTDINKLIKEF